MEINRRQVLLSGLSAGLAGMVPASLLAAGQDSGSQPALDQTNILRHYVLATAKEADMDSALALLKEKLDLSSQPKKHLTELGFSTAMVIIGKTVIEVVAPVARGARPYVDEFMDARGEPGWYKIVFQTFDADAIRKRLYAMKVKLDFDREFRGEQMLTLNTEIFGTSLEAFTYADLSKWWGYDSAIDYPESSLVEEVLGCEVAMDNPGAVATLVAAIFNAELDPDTKVVRFQKNLTQPFEERYMRFVAPEDERRGMLKLDVKVKDRSRVGETVSIYGADFLFL